MQVDNPAGTCVSRLLVERVLAGEDVEPSVLQHLAKCARCRALADSVRRDNELVEELRRHDLDLAASRGQVGQVAGYEIIREIHRGAQGVVFEAIQMATKRRVAVKTIGRGRFATSRQRARFEREIEIVAALRHPNIATLYESGTTSDGAAYFAMEYVDGVALNEARDWPSVPPRDTARLFARICLAVAHAHQHGVIHRDLKPGNILVDRDGEPRVLDFGLARSPCASQDESSAEIQFAGTFAYASPEQLEGRTDQVDLRSDVYALGLILFELLTGTAPHPPYRRLSELIAARRDAAPASPRERRAGIDRDLETMVLKALAPDPLRRYRSAGDFCEDLERYLDGRPIHSRQDNIGYVLVKLVQRHRRLATLLLGVAALVLVLLTVALGLFIRHEQEQDKSMDTLAALQQVLEAADPLSGLSTNTRLDVFLDHVGRNVQSHLSDQPQIAATIHTTLGQVALNMADYSGARAHFAEALALRQRSLPRDDPALAESLHNLGRAAFFLGQYDEAVALYQQALERRTTAFGSAHPDVANTMSHLASCLRRLGDQARAEDLLRKALEIRESHPQSTAAEIAASVNNLGSLLLETDRYDEALMHFERSLAMIEEVVGPHDWRVAHALQNRAACLRAMNQHVRAEADLRRAHAIWAAVVTPDHPSLARVQVELARTSLDLGDVAGAESRVREATEIARLRLGSRHPELAAGLELLGEILIRRSSFEEAAEVLKTALEIRLETAPSNRRSLVDTMTMLAECFIGSSQFDEAERLLLEALNQTDDSAGARGRLVGLIIDLYRRCGRVAEAEAWQAELNGLGSSTTPETRDLIEEQP